METTMGRVTTEATIENIKDLWAVECGLKPADQARRLLVEDALVDTGATMLSMPTRLIKQLGLNKSGSRHITSSVGKGLSAATLDTNFQNRRRISRTRNKPRHAIAGVTHGASSRANSVVSGVTGVLAK